MKKWLMLAPLIIPFIYLFCMPFRPAWFELMLFFILAAGYRQSYVDAKRRELYIIVQILAVSFMGAVDTPWILSLGLYPAIGMGMLASYRRISWMAGIMAAFFCGSIVIFYEQLSAPWRYEWLPIILALVSMPYVLRLYQRAYEVKMKLQDANDEIARLIKNEERQRIARDLHDTLGHTLSLITLKSELVERLITIQPDQALQEARDVQQISRSTLLQVRELVSDMQSIDIEEEFRHAGEIFHTAGIAFEYHNNNSMKTAPIIRNILGMCLRECVTNVIKHSGANRCTVNLCEEPGEYMLHVHDNGIGMIRDNKRLGQFGNGLLGMKERLLLIEGKLELASDQAWGTKVTITVPKIGRA